MSRYTIIDSSKLTNDQDHIFSRCLHFVPIEILPDGDVLIVDAEGYGPYIVLRNGCVQSVDHHYKNYHGLDIKTRWERDNE